MHLAPLIRDLAVILGVAGIMSLIFQRIRQPVVLGYILAGVFVGPYTPPFQLVTDVPSIQTWAELGVIFLMFTLGLEFSFRKLAQVGFPASITAGTEVLFFLPVGYFVGQLFGWTPMDSIFLGAILSISSTTIIIKALSDLKLRTHRFAELIFGVLIVEDLIAILLIVALSTIATSHTVSGLALLAAALKLVLVVGGWFLAGYFVIPRFMRYVGKVGNDEMLTILSLSLCLALVVFAVQFHYSAALGAFIMGSILAESPVLKRIEERMEPLRDLFAAVFFVSIGMLINPQVLLRHWKEVLILSAVTIVGKIISTSTGALLSGQTFRNSVQVGFGLAQIGEFSFIIASLGLSLHATSDFVYPIAVAVSLVTTFTTPYLIRASGNVAAMVENALPSRIRSALNRYAAWSESKRTQGSHQDSLKGPILRWLINGLIVSVIFVLNSEWLRPYLGSKEIFTGIKLSLLAFFSALIISLPFIWAMLSATSLLVFRSLTLIWIGALSSEFFPGKYVILITGVALIIFFGLFYRKLEASYHWFERTFLSNFQKGHEEKTKAASLNHLAPWDGHLVTIQVHPNANLIGKRLEEAELRNRFGVNVVAIQRGLHTIVPPKPAELILPNDELIVLGNDEQVDNIKKELEVPSGHLDPAKAPTSYELRHIKLENEVFAGKTIRQSGIRERFHSMVVGLERQGKRSTNPDSDLQLLVGDTLWLVGEKAQLDRLAAHCNPEV
ncbi:cation:proton antiporter [bacterium]|jgi:CPA2 family monovalent cation:H+ antiporter-2|nr:cation:proton antiporter [bacterium]